MALEYRLLRETAVDRRRRSDLRWATGRRGGGGRDAGADDIRNHTQRYHLVNFGEMADGAGVESEKWPRGCLHFLSPPFSLCCYCTKM